jgi:molybdenum cofactor biosynthesis enzyme MoaA
MTEEKLKELVARLYLAIAFLKECNYKCGYCHPFGESKITHDENLSKTELEEVIAAATDYGFRTFRFTGGECTLLPWFADILEYTIDLNPKVKVNVCTNGSTLDKYLDLFEKHKNNINLRISLDSTNPEHYRLGFYKILTPKLEKSLREVSRREIPARFNVVVMQSNKTEVNKIIELASELGFDVKLLDLYVQDQYIATSEIVENNKMSPQLNPLEYWKRNYVNLNEFVPEFEKRSSRKITHYNKDGGFGIPMYAFEINGIKVIFKDSTKGSFYHPKECIKSCPYFGTMCQEGMYNPHVSSNMVLHVNGCYNPKLRWNLRGTSHEQKLQAFNEILALFTNLQYIHIPPHPIKFYLNNNGDKNGATTL